MTSCSNLELSPLPLNSNQLCCHFIRIAAKYGIWIVQIVFVLWRSTGNVLLLVGILRVWKKMFPCLSKLQVAFVCLDTLNSKFRFIWILFKTPSQSSLCYSACLFRNSVNSKKLNAVLFGLSVLHSYFISLRWQEPSTYTSSSTLPEMALDQGPLKTARFAFRGQNAEGRTLICCCQQEKHWHNTQFQRNRRISSKFLANLLASWVQQEV